MAHQTIIPYVGGKQKVARQLVSYFPKGITEMGSPFIGGGSVEVLQQAKGVQVYAGDRLRELAVFWQMMCSRAVDVAEGFKARLPIAYPLDRYREELLAGTDDINTAVLFYILIESGFSHILTRTGGSPRNVRTINRRGWRSRYARLRRFLAPNLSVYWYDCFKFLDRFPDLFLYCDPPYANGSQNLYGFSEDLHSGFPHVRWAEALRGRDFVQSYGDCAFIRELYEGWCHIEELNWYYSAAGGKKIGHELVIRPK